MKYFRIFRPSDVFTFGLFCSETFRPIYTYIYPRPNYRTYITVENNRSENSVVIGLVASSSSPLITRPIDRLNPSYTLSRTDWLRRRSHEVRGAEVGLSCFHVCHVLCTRDGGRGWVGKRKNYGKNVNQTCTLHLHHTLCRRRHIANLSDSRVTSMRVCIYMYLCIFVCVHSYVCECQTNWQHPFPLFRRPKTPLPSHIEPRRSGIIRISFSHFFFAFFWFFPRVFYHLISFIRPVGLLSRVTCTVYARKIIRTSECYR